MCKVDSSKVKHLELRMVGYAVSSILNSYMEGSCWFEVCWAVGWIICPTTQQTSIQQSMLFFVLLLVGFGKDAKLGFEQCDLLAGTLHLLLELGLQKVGLLTVGEEAEVVLP